MEKLYVNSKKHKAIQSILAAMKSEGVPAADQQYKEAEVQCDKALLSTMRETFITLYYPNKNGIVSSDFKLEFKGNKFDGEEQVIAVLKEILWAVENNDPSGIPTALRNWLGLRSEERWRLYTITNASTGTVNDSKRGWRAALRCALCENTVDDRPYRQLSLADMVKGEE